MSRNTSETDVVEGPTATRLRGNGKQQSCEPCRKAKVRCDHKLPCGRCLRREISSNCTYHPCPMARTRNGETRVSMRRTSTPINTRPCSPTKMATLAGVRKPSVHTVNPLTLESGASIGYERAPPKLFVGYMGPTGHSAILFDNTVSLGADVLLDDPKETGPESAQKTVKRRAFCLAILGWLPSRHVCEQLMDHFYRVSCVVTPPREVMRHFHLQFWATYEEFFKEPRKPEKVALVGDVSCLVPSVSTFCFSY